MTQYTALMVFNCLELAILLVLLVSELKKP